MDLLSDLFHGEKGCGEGGFGDRQGVYLRENLKNLTANGQKKKKIEPRMDAN